MVERYNRTQLNMLTIGEVIIMDEIVGTAFAICHSLVTMNIS